MSLRPTHQLCPRISSGHASARATHQVGASLKPAHASPRPTRISSAHASALPTNQFCPRISLVHAQEPGPRISLIRGSYGPGPSISQLRPPFDLNAQQAGANSNVGRPYREGGGRQMRAWHTLIREALHSTPPAVHPGFSTHMRIASSNTIAVANRP